jgi:hypothetical protein
MATYQRTKNWYIDFIFHGQRIREMIGPRKGTGRFDPLFLIMTWPLTSFPIGVEFQ